MYYQAHRYVADWDFCPQELSGLAILVSFLKYFNAKVDPGPGGRRGV